MTRTDNCPNTIKILIHLYRNASDLGPSHKVKSVSGKESI